MSGPFVSFGGTVASTANVLGGLDTVDAISRGIPTGMLLPVGNGCSYGDSCQNASGSVVDMRDFRRLVTFDPETGVLEAEAGVMLASIIRNYGPRGWFPAVVPGTRWVTLGGAIANDIHGKNHHRRGSFGCHVERLTLLRTDGTMQECSAEQNAEMFSATIGGMGLTGIILRAAIRLMPVTSIDVEETATGFDRLEDYFDIAGRADADNEYAVAWIDQLATGNQRGRGVLLAGNHAKAGAYKSASRKPWLSVPFQPPFTALSRAGIKAFNTAYRWSQLRKPGKRHAAWDKFFFPLDAVSHWNRLYGPSGLYQHQSVLPEGSARQAVATLIETSQRFGQASFLTVLKRFGDMRSPAILSFARPGFTLTLDFPNRGAATLAMLDELDSIAIDAGGAVNPYKDARRSAATFEASFKDWPDLEAHRDFGLRSDFWKRTAEKLARSRTVNPAAE